MRPNQAIRASDWIIGFALAGIAIAFAIGLPLAVAQRDEPTPGEFTMIDKKPGGKFACVIDPSLGREIYIDCDVISEIMIYAPLMSPDRFNHHTVYMAIGAKSPRIDCKDLQAAHEIVDFIKRNTTPKPEAKP